MLDAIQSMITELEQEGATTRRLLERVPEDKFGWKPHAKSMSLGQLANHIASIPWGVGNLLNENGLDARTAGFEPAHPNSKEELFSVLEKGVANAISILKGWDQNQALSPWKLTHGEKEIFTMPRISFARTVLLNHWYHHRGQLTVYLRLLDCPLPVTYGRSADENPFG